MLQQQRERGWQTVTVALSNELADVFAIVAFLALSEAVVLQWKRTASAVTVVTTTSGEGQRARAMPTGGRREG